MEDRKGFIKKMAFLLHQLLSESATQYPDNEAIVFEDHTITYAELERKTNKLAHELHTQGIVKGSRVGIHMSRGITSIIAACGILKAGAAYVPIDPMAPLGRLQYIITKCGISTLLTAQKRLTAIEKAFPENSPLENIIVMDDVNLSYRLIGSTRLISWQDIPDDYVKNAPYVNILDSDLAYILFTSGSTGNPKGVMISHLNSLTFVNSVHDFFRITQDDRLSNNSPLHFDLSIFDIFVAIKAGASVAIVPEAISIFPAKLAEFIEKNKISVWNSVPSALSLLATYEKLGSYNFERLRLILFAGEVFPLKYLRRLQKSIPAAHYYNMYGQTEANSSLYHRVGQIPSDVTTAIPIGKTFSNFEVFAIDENRKKISQPGDKGELYVRGPSVAMGYWNEPKKTEASFVKNPFGTSANELIYKTGDLVTLDAEGNYLFLGRKDHMIKSRGYRIEIGEIETTLENCEQVKTAVIIPVSDELIGNRIAAIIVPSSDSCIQKKEIIRHCSQRLPKYMIPEIIEFHDALPMTSSGKVDRKKLTEQMGQIKPGGLMRDEPLVGSTVNLKSDGSASTQSVESIDPNEFGIIARVLAEAYAEDPVLLWAMPRAATRQADATAFFTFFLRRIRPHRREVFATSDRSAVAVMTRVAQRDRKSHDNSRTLPTLVRMTSPVAEYFRWIETFRPDVEHQYLEFIGRLPMPSSRGQGTFLLESILTTAAREGIPVWSWSSNPRNLNFYRRLGFDTGTELRRDVSTPAVTLLRRPPDPLSLSPS